MSEKDIKLDVRDRRLLVELNFDARQANAELAKKLRLSKKGVEYKIKRLEKAGVIEGYYPVVNFPVLGYLYCRVFLKLQYMTAEKKAEMVLFIQQHPKMHWSIWARGIYDLAIGIWVRTFTEFKDVVSEFVMVFEPFVKESNLSLVTELEHLRYNFLTGREDFTGFSIKEASVKEGLDDTDLAVLEALARNGRNSLVELAAAAKLTAKTISYRLRTLRERRILLTTRASVNHQRLGYTHYKVFFSLRSNSRQKMMELRAHLKKQPAVIYLVDDIGITDLDVEMMFRSNDEFFRFLDNFQFRFSELIRDYQYMIYTETLKVSYLPF